MNVLDTPTKVNGGAVRIVALFTVVIGIGAAWSGSTWLAALLAVDFGLRALISPRYSPLARVARLVQPYSPFRGTPIFFAPKRFAARIGLVLSAAGALSMGLGAGTLGAVVLGVLGFFALLEGAFGFCVGCKIYGLLIRRGIVSGENCPDCS